MDSFFSIKENDDFRIISRMKLERSVSSFPAIDQRNLSDDHPMLEVCCSVKIVVRTRGGSLVMLGNRTIDGTEKLPIYGAFYSFYFRDVSLFESFITLVEKVFSLIRREKHRLLEFYNTRTVKRRNIRGCRVKSEER